MKLGKIDASLSSDFAESVKQACGENIYLCFQCKKCAVGCPLMFAMDLTPTQIIHAIGLGLEDTVLNSRTMWLCASCETCSTRCPQGVDIARIMDGVKIIAQNRGVKPPVISIPAFYSAALSNIKIFGRMYELGLMADLKRRTGEFTKDMGLGIKMFSKGKLKIMPHYSSRARRIFNRVEKLERKGK
jgi:heterodisulfide reductase subunit C